MSNEFKSMVGKTIQSVTPINPEWDGEGVSIVFTDGTAVSIYERMQAGQIGYDDSNMAQERIDRERVEKAARDAMWGRVRTHASYTEHSLPVINLQDLFQAHEAKTNKD